MSRPRVKITLIDRKGPVGCHRGHQVGDSWDFDTQRGEICPMAMHVAFPYVDILRYGGEIPQRALVQEVLGQEAHWGQSLCEVPGLVERVDLCLTRIREQGLRAADDGVFGLPGQVAVIEVEDVVVAHALLYGLALIGGSYGPLLPGGEWALLTRNGPFFSLLFVALGAELRLRGWQPDARCSALLMVAGMVLYALEAEGLLHFAAVPLNRHDFLLGSLPWALGLFGLLLANPNWGRGSWLERQAPKVLGLYCLHMMLVVWLMVFGPQGKLLWWELVKVPVLLVLSLLACRLLATNRISGWLLRAR